MDGEILERARVLPAGIPGDRGWAVRDKDGRPLSAKRHAALMLCRARYLEEPRPGEPPPPAELALPDGRTVRTGDREADEALSELLGLSCALGREPDGAGHFDARPLHLLTRSTLDTMAAGGLDFRLERFRPNLLLADAAPGRPEDGWVGRSLRVGAVRVEVLKPTKRCVMTTLPQPGVEARPAVLKAVVAAGGALGVYARALEAGDWRLGDECATLDP